MSAMTLYAWFFYLIGLFTVVTTALAVTRRNAVHAVICLILSLLGLALLFYLLGAPVVAALEVILYAGGIMVLFLFILVVVGPRISGSPAGPRLRLWLPAGLLAVLALGATAVLLRADPGSRTVLAAAAASPEAFGRFVFGRYWFAVEIASLLLFAALVGALYLGRGELGPGEGPP